MKNTIMILGLLLCLSHQASAAGFVGGNQLTSSYIEGKITVSCRDLRNGDTSFNAFRCVANYITPSAKAQFVGPQNTGANQVTLRNTREDGSVKEKTEYYDSAKGISKGKFNLLVNTLLQRPLLKLGKNQLQYALTKEEKVLKKGSFEVQVNQGEDRTCSHLGHYESNILDDCRYSERFCPKYFADEDYCR